MNEISYQASITAGIRIKGEEHGNKTQKAIEGKGEETGCG
ncbi:Uncharacterised protein [Shigella sonnei]|nr:Uncharacterised protein [Shigella sonnei]